MHSQSPSQPPPPHVGVPLTDTTHSFFPFLQLPRELRDQIYSHVLCIPDTRSRHVVHIQRRFLRYLTPTAGAASILLVLHHEYFLVNRQIAREALEVLFKKHVVYFSGGPSTIKTLLEHIELPNGPRRQWLKWLKDVELDWVTFPNLKSKPPVWFSRPGEECYEEHHDDMYAADNVYGTYSGNLTDEHDNYDYHDRAVFPPFRMPPTTTNAPSTNDPFGLANHYPFTDPSRDPAEDSFEDDLYLEDVDSKLDYLVTAEVTPLFDYLASPTFNLTSITLPLYFISIEFHQRCVANRRNNHGSHAPLPVELRYWVRVLAHALYMLHSSRAFRSPSTNTGGEQHAMPTLKYVRVNYSPWDTWAAMDPTDDLQYMVQKGIWFDEPDEDHVARQGESETFHALWTGLETHHGLEKQEVKSKIDIRVTFWPWDGDMSSSRVGDELEVVFDRKKEQGGEEVVE